MSHSSLWFLCLCSCMECTGKHRKHLLAACMHMCMLKMNKRIPYGSQTKPRALTAKCIRLSQPIIPALFYELLWVIKTEASELACIVQPLLSAPLMFCLFQRAACTTMHICGCQGTNSHFVKTGFLVQCCLLQVSQPASFQGLGPLSWL